MTADQDLSARLDAMKEPALQYDSVQDEFHAALDAAYRSGQLITIADHKRAVQAAVARAVEAEREAAAQIADAYADENIRMAGDSVLFDPVLSSKRGDVLTRGDFVKSEELILDGAIHSSMFHAAQNIAAAIRSRGVAG